VTSEAPSFAMKFDKLLNDRRLSRSFKTDEIVRSNLHIGRSLSEKIVNFRERQAAPLEMRNTQRKTPPFTVSLSESALPTDSEALRTSQVAYNRSAFRV
jgi:hypothetical protein